MLKLNASPLFVIFAHGVLDRLQNSFRKFRFASRFRQGFNTIMLLSMALESPNCLSAGYNSLTTSGMETSSCKSTLIRCLLYSDNRGRGGIATDARCSYVVELTHARTRGAGLGPYGARNLE